ncbi:hypothetical protein Dimus_024888 [Dionaea muscipula]
MHSTSVQERVTQVYSIRLHPGKTVAAADDEHEKIHNEGLLTRYFVMHETSSHKKLLLLYQEDVIRLPYSDMNLRRLILHPKLLSAPRCE